VSIDLLNADKFIKTPYGLVVKFSFFGYSDLLNNNSIFSVILNFESTYSNFLAIQNYFWL